MKNTTKADKIGIFARTVVALSLIASVVGCGSSTPAKMMMPSTNATLVSIAVTPSTLSIAIGATQQFTAKGTYSDQTMKDVTVTWSSGTAATATISTSGLATGVAAGTTVISATSGTVTGTANLTVSPANTPPPMLVSITVSPAAPSIIVGATQTFTAQGKYSDGNTMDLSTTVTWASATTATATIASTGVATGVAAGSTVISATSGSVVGNAALTVTAPKTLVSIAVTATASSIAKGTTSQLTATGTYSDTSTADITATATWTSATAATATVSAAGLVTGVAGGTSVITATSGTISGTTTITVTVTQLVSIAVSAPAATIATGTSQQYVATGTFKDAANVMTTQNISAMVTWASATTATATISATGLVTASTTPGTTVISATSGTGATAIVGMTTLTVNKAALSSIAVTTTPSSSIAKGATAKFIATGTFADATTQDLSAQVTWASATPATATISNVAGTIGVATSLAVGTTVISATLGTGATAIVGTLTLTVTGATLVSIAVTAAVLPQPSATPSIAKNTTVQMIATGTYSDSTTPDITNLVNWTSTAGATISNAADSKGLATAGNAAATPMITATFGTGATAIAKTITLTVTNVTLLSINVTPATFTIAAGTTKQFQATGFFSDFSQQDMTETASWTSVSVPATAASVSSVAGSKGLAKGVKTGTSTITATVGNISDTAALTVSTALLVSITIDPPTPGLALGTSLTLKATGLYSDQSQQDLTTQVSWSSSKQTIAKISSAGATSGLVTTVAKGTTDITASFAISATQNVTTTVTLTVADIALKSIAVTSATTPATIEKGTTLQFSAVGTYTDGSTQDLTKAVSWKSDKTAVATMSNVAGSLGLATGAGVGAASITAVSSVASGSIVSNAVVLTVNDGKLLSIAVTPAAPSIAAGTNIQLTATGTYDDGAKQDITDDVAWASDTKATATVNTTDNKGLASALVTGTAKITASQTVGAVTVAGNTVLNVSTAKLTAIAIQPYPTASVANGTTLQFTAVGSFEDNTTQDLTDTATWASSAVAMATISTNAATNGVAKGAKEGTTKITASVVIGGVTTTSLFTTLTVTPAVLTSIAVTVKAPATTATVPDGATLDLVATGTYSDLTTQVLTGGAVNWTTASMATATVSNQVGQRGRVTGAAVGTVLITATSSTDATKLGSITVMVTAPVVATIAVTPANPAALVKAHTQQFMAQATLTDGTKQDVSATATWNSTMTGAAAISTTGLATGVAAGMTKISAVSGGVTSNVVTLTVTN
jgi:hypothetical protein